MNDPTITDLQQRALAVARLYDEKNRKAGEKNWKYDDYVDGLVGDVGDLVKLVMAKKGLRHQNDLDIKIEHELHDILWSVLVLYDRLGIPSTSFISAMDKLEEKVGQEIEQ